MELIYRGVSMRLWSGNISVKRIHVCVHPAFGRIFDIWMCWL